MTFARVALCVAVTTLVPHVLVAQRASPSRPIELGIDAAVIHESGDDRSSTAITLPVSRFRIGFFLSDAISFEPSLAIQYTRVTVENPLTGRDVTRSETSYDMEFGLLYHFSPARTQTQTFVRPFLGVVGVSGDVPHGSQPIFGVALGFKKPFTNRLAGRFEFGYAHKVEDEPNFPSTNSLFFSFGLSFFTH